LLSEVLVGYGLDLVDNLGLQSLGQVADQGKAIATSLEASKHH